MYIEEFIEQFTDDIYYESIESALIENGYKAELYNESDLPRFIENLEAPENDWMNLRFEHYTEMQEEVEQEIISRLNNKPQLKKYICGILRPFQMLSELIYPSPDSDEDKLASARFLKDLHEYNLPGQTQIESIAQKLIAELKADSDFPSLPREEKEKVFNTEFQKRVDDYSQMLKSNRYRIATLTIGMMEELAVFITAILLENGETTTIFDYQRMCGVALTGEIYPFYLTRTMDWTPELSKSYLPTPIFYYSDSPEALLKMRLYNDDPYVVNGASLCGIDEIDCLFKQIKRNEPNYSEAIFTASLPGFRERCRQMAESDKSMKEKEAWIVKILNSLSEVYYNFVQTENVNLAYYARHFMVVIEAEFMKAAEQLCVRNLFRQLGIDCILDVENPEIDEGVIQSRQENGLHPITWEESLIRKEIGPSLSYQEKRLCKECGDRECHYRAGQRDFFWENQEAGLTPDEYSDIPDELRTRSGVFSEHGPTEEDFERMEEEQRIKAMTPVEKFCHFYGGRPAIDLIVKILVDNGMEESVINYSTASVKAIAEDIIIEENYGNLFSLSYWDELKESIANGIDLRKYDKAAMRQYISSLLAPFGLISRYFYPKDEDGDKSKAAAAFLWDYACKSDPAYAEYAQGKDKLVRALNDGRYRSGVPTPVMVKLTQWHSNQNVQDLMRSYLGAGMDWILLRVYEGITKYAAIIDGQLLEVENHKRLADYQRDFGLILTDKLDIVDVSIENGKPIEYFQSIITGRQIPSIAESTPYQKRGDAVIPPAESPSPIAQENQAETGNDAITITEKMRAYLEAFRQEGFLDDEFHWIHVKGHTTYHAGWMAKIIISNVEDVTYGRIEDIIKQKGLTDAASKCVTQSKHTKQADIEAVCTKHGLSKKTY